MAEMLLLLLARNLPVVTHSLAGSGTPQYQTSLNLAKVPAALLQRTKLTQRRYSLDLRKIKFGNNSFGFYSALLKQFQSRRYASFQFYVDACTFVTFKFRNVEDYRNKYSIICGLHEI
jgi:hypothetical protein